MLRDLTPISDPKGGSPKTPVPQSVRKLLAEDETTKVFIQTPNGNGNGHWKAILSTLGGIVLGIGVILAIGEHIAEFNSLSKTVQQHDDTIKFMNDHGTAYTRWQMEQDLKFHEDVEKRLRELERK